MRVENWCGYDIRFVEVNGEWCGMMLNRFRLNRKLVTDILKGGNTYEYY